MSPDDVMAVATVVGVVIAGLFGVTGFVVGLIGLHHANKAKEAAAGANLIAKDANSIATRANTLSTEANSIAREANEIARASEVRATEQHDVTWDCDWKSPGLYAVRNEGKQTAHKVWIQITVGDEVEEASLDVIEGGQTVLLEMPKSRAIWEAEQRAEQERQRPKHTSGPFGGFSTPNLSVPALNYHYVRDRILWRTELGTPREHDKSFNLGSVGP
ncbi:hypothetical protein [Microbacterium sp. PM5]|uniref:hypothetical protein n=1 Tax=Microbacterium sp. PM5 TaxID=2014534 RepID=UPI000DD1887E|nr:hypothetical protein [Microbacterium sp. PM5]AXA95284.1 hypothetical protein CEP17_01980 [Microbacterium sp. PM5]